MLKLPRNSMLPDQAIAVTSFFTNDVRKVSDGNETLVTYLSVGEPLQQALRVTSRTGCTTRGLETIAKFLDDEKKGLVQVQQKTGQPEANRMSRLLLLSNDGSERFYRQAATLLTAHKNRVWGCRLDVTEEVLGSLVLAPGSAAKAVLINDKKALASFLTELARLL